MPCHCIRFARTSNIIRNMKRLTILIFSVLIILAWGCNSEQSQSPIIPEETNEQHTEKIRQRVKEDALGLEMNYKSISFEWQDTLYVSEVIKSIQNLVVSLPDVESVEIFSDEFITKENLLKLRNWEDNKRGVPFNKEYRLYTDFAKNNTDKSAWLKELSDRIAKTDEILSKWDSVSVVENNSIVWLHLIEYYRTIDKFYTSRPQLTELWDELEAQINNIKGKAPNDVVSYRALNVFTINNPAFNSVEQELKQYFVFNSDFEIIDRLDSK